MELKCLFCGEERKSPRGLFYHCTVSHKGLFNSYSEMREYSYAMVSKSMNEFVSRNHRRRSKLRNVLSGTVYGQRVKSLGNCA